MVASKQGTPLRLARIACGMSNKEVAEATGISAGNLSRLEQGKHKASPDLAEKLAKLFGISEMLILYPERYKNNLSIYEIKNISRVEDEKGHLLNKALEAAKNAAQNQALKAGKHAFLSTLKKEI